jgi:hypothetical protein
MQSQHFIGAFLLTRQDSMILHDSSLSNRGRRWMKWLRSGLRLLLLGLHGRFGLSMTADEKHPR